MSDSNTDLQVLLKNIQLGLQTYTIKELNDALLKILSEKSDKYPEINRILIIVSARYKITKTILLTSTARGEFQNARMIAYCLLHFVLGISVRKIGKIFNRGHNCVTTAIKTFKKIEPERFRIDRELSEMYKECLNDFISNDNNK
jgi:chromosomal replication initiation ATPase DnaA